MQSEKDILLARLNDCLNSSLSKNIPKFLGFLSESELSDVNKFIDVNKCNVKFFGGFDNAKRQIVAFLPDWADDEFDDFPIVPIRADFNSSYSLTHRDFLGALMGLGITRDRVGDIVVTDGSAIMFVHNSISNFVMNELTKAGRVGLKLSVGLGDFQFPEQQFEDISSTVASARIDCVVASLIGVSRDKVTSIILSGSVCINGLEIKNNSVRVSENSVIAILKHGKYIIDSLSQTTKKGRLKLIARKYK